MVVRKGAHGCCGSFGDLLRELFELPVKHLTTLALLLLKLNFVLVTITILALPVTGLVELDIGGFSEELNVLESR